MVVVVVVVIVVVIVVIVVIVVLSCHVQGCWYSFKSSGRNGKSRGGLHVVTQ